MQAGRRLPLLIVVLLILLAAGVYIRWQFGRVQNALQTQDPRLVVQKTSPFLATEPQPVAVDPAVMRARADEIRSYDPSAPARSGSVQPDRPVQPDVPLQH